MSLKYFLLIFGLFSAANTLRLPERRIVNGKIIDISEVPWQVALLGNSRLMCGGSIVANRIIITAAHCVIQSKKPVPARAMTIVAGSTYWQSGGQRIGVKDYKAHEDYGTTEDFVPTDIAVLHLAQSLEFSPKVQPIALSRLTPKVNDKPFVSGWGSTVFEEILSSDALRGFETRITYMSEGEITTRTVARSAAQGDSGGPLALNGSLIGVFSAFKVTGYNYFPNVANLYNWIQTAIKDLENRL